MRVKLPMLGLGIAALVAFSLLLFHPQSTSIYAPPRFVLIDVRVVDNLTAQPIVGAMVYPICLGGTRYATNSYRTDNQGTARIATYESMTAARIAMPGYEEAFLGFGPANKLITAAVVRLKRLPK